MESFSADRMKSGVTTSYPIQTIGQSSSGGMVRSIFIDGPAGRLEAILNEGASNAPFAALVSHPHPLGGGNMHNKVVYHAMKTLNDPVWGLGWPVLRFNFRGTGLSQGEHDGRAESEDVLAALEWLSREYGRPILAAGFSFGAAMTLGAWTMLPGVGLTGRVRALALLGLPIDALGRHYIYPELADCVLPRLFLSGGSDPFAPADQLQKIVAEAAEPKELQLISGADHFFTGRLDAMQSALADWLKVTVVKEYVP